MRHMTEVQRMERHEQIVRDSYRQQQQGLRDWARLLMLLGLERNEITDTLSSMRTDIAFIITEIEQDRFRG